MPARSVLRHLRADTIKQLLRQGLTDADIQRAKAEVAKENAAKSSEVREPIFTRAIHAIRKGFQEFAAPDHG